MIVYGEPICEWVSAKTGGKYQPGTGQGIGIERNGQIVAGALFDNWNGNAVHVSVAINPGTIPNREWIWMICDYPFNQLKVKKCVGFVESANLQAIRFDEHLGFIREATLKDAGKYGDLYIYTITKDQCRILQEKRYGKQQRRKRASNT